MSKEELLQELQKISKLLTFAYSEKIESELEKVANTNNRKMMWVLIDGIRGAPDIAKELDVSGRAVRDFLNQAKPAGLIDYIRNKPPVKLIDYVPPSWIELLLKETEKGEGDDE